MPFKNLEDFNIFK